MVNSIKNILQTEKKLKSNFFPFSFTHVNFQNIQPIPPANTYLFSIGRTFLHPLHMMQMVTVKQQKTVNA